MSLLFVKQQAVSFVMIMQKGKESKVLPHGIVFLQPAVICIQRIYILHNILSIKKQKTKIHMYNNIKLLA